MIIENISGVTPGKIRQPDQKSGDSGRSVTGRAENNQYADKNSSISAKISERSKTAIKAFRIVSEIEPAISRALRVAQIKAEVARGTYQPSSSSIADSVLFSVAR